MSIDHIKEKRLRPAFTLLEVVVAAALFALFSVGVVGVVLAGLRANQVAGEKRVANQYVSEGLEAVRSIKKQSFANLSPDKPATGVSNLSGVWAFSGDNNTFDKFTRTIAVGPVNRDTDGNIVGTGGTPDPNTKKISVTVNWAISGSLHDSISLYTYLSNWSVITPPAPTCGDGIQNGDETDIDCGGSCPACPIPPNQKSGFLVYSTGGTTADSYVYRTINLAANTWNDPIPMPDIDPNTSNRALRMVKAYASPSSSARKEKIIISRHFDTEPSTAPHNQYIYAQIYNSTTGTFVGTPTLLSTIGDNSSLYQQNFDGTYLANGDFMAIYTDNSNTPKYRIWNGSAWGTMNSMPTIGGIPNWIVVRSRPGTNEAMAAFFSQNYKTSTEYFNGSTWTSSANHSNKAPSNYHQLVDFAWSPNNSKIGALVYAENDIDRSITAKIWTADEHGSGSWSSAANSATQASGRYVADMRVIDLPGTDQFMACDEDNNPASRIYCFNLDFTPTFSTPANNVIADPSDNGPQRAFDIAFPSLSGAIGLGVYSDKTNIAKLKKFNAGTASWDNSATSAGTLSGILKTVALKRDPLSNDIIILMADDKKNLYTEVWNGGSNQIYASPSWKSLTNQQALGSANEECWFDFAWDD